MTTRVPNPRYGVRIHHRDGSEVEEWFGPDRDSRNARLQALLTESGQPGSTIIQIGQLDDPDVADPNARNPLQDGLRSFDPGEDKS